MYFTILSIASIKCFVLVMVLSSISGLPKGFYSFTHKKAPTLTSRGFLIVRCLAVTYFHMRSAHYHRRNFVSRSCSGWEGVDPKRYGRQA